MLFGVFSGMNTSWMRWFAFSVLLLPLVDACCDAQEGPDPKESTVAPTLEVNHADYYQGEQIQIKIGNKAPMPVDALLLAGQPSEIRLVRADGTLIFKKIFDRPIVYSGPSRTQSLSHVESLNDLAKELPAGSYKLSHKSGDKEVSCGITIWELPLLAKMRVRFEFPDRVELSEDEPIKIKLTLFNDSASPIQFVVPNTDYWANVAGYITSSNPPMFTRLKDPDELSEAQKPNSRVPIRNENLARLQLATVQPSASCAFQVVFVDSLARTDKSLPKEAAQSMRKERNQWLPKESFELVAGLVLYIIAPTGDAQLKRPVELLFRSKVSYLANGTKLADELKSDYPDWATVMPVVEMPNGD